MLSDGAIALLTSVEEDLWEETLEEQLEEQPWDRWAGVEQGSLRRAQPTACGWVCTWWGAQPCCAAPAPLHAAVQHCSPLLSTAGPARPSCCPACWRSTRRRSRRRRPPAAAACRRRRGWTSGACWCCQASPAAAAACWSSWRLMKQRGRPRRWLRWTDTCPRCCAPRRGPLAACCCSSAPGRCCSTLRAAGWRRCLPRRGSRSPALRWRPHQERQPAATAAPPAALPPLVSLLEDSCTGARASWRPASPALR